MAATFEGSIHSLDNNNIRHPLAPFSIEQLFSKYVFESHIPPYITTQVIALCLMAALLLPMKGDAVPPPPIGMSCVINSETLDLTDPHDLLVAVYRDEDYKVQGEVRYQTKGDPLMKNHDGSLSLWEYGHIPRSIRTLHGAGIVTGSSVNGIYLGYSGWTLPTWGHIGTRYAIPTHARYIEEDGDVLRIDITNSSTIYDHGRGWNGVTPPISRISCKD